MVDRQMGVLIAVGVRVLLLAAVVALILAGCSDGSDDSEGAGGETAGSNGEPAVESGGSAAPVALLESDAFAALLEEQPDQSVVNVHVPYEGHLEGTTDFVHFEQIAGWDGLPANLDEPIVMYCRSGRMSGIAAQELAALGYTDITDLAGGFQAWEAAGKELILDPSVMALADS